MFYWNHRNIDFFIARPLNSIVAWEKDQYFYVVIYIS